MGFLKWGYKLALDGRHGTQSLTLPQYVLNVGYWDCNVEVRGIQLRKYCGVISLCGMKRLPGDRCVRHNSHCEHDQMSVTQTGKMSEGLPNGQSDPRAP